MSPTLPLWMRASIGAFVAVLMAQGCVIGSEKYPRPRDLNPTSLVDRTRVLSVVAEPPEMRPGERATFRALVATPGADTPEDGGLTKLWLACPVDDAGNGFGCVVDFDNLDIEELGPAELAELGFIGFEPGLPPAYTAPDDLLDGLEEEERLEGRYVNVQVTALPDELLETTGTGAAPALDFNEVEVAYKRLVVSEALTPNQNPSIRTFTVDRVEVGAETLVEVDAEQSYELGVLLPDGAREAYVFVNSDGEEEQRVEEPYVAWYATAGDMTEEVTLYPYLEATWVAPAESGETGTWYAVLRDRRGGQAFWVQRYIVR